MGNYKFKVINGSITGEDLYDVNLEDTNLAGVTFKRCTFNGVVFSNVDLRGAKFMQCKFNGVIFRVCDMTDLNVNIADVKNVELSKCNLKGAKLVALGGGELKAYNSDLDFIHVLHCNLTYMEFHQCKLRRVLTQLSKIRLGAFNESNLSFSTLYLSEFSQIEIINCIMNSLDASTSIVDWTLKGNNKQLNVKVNK